jgi:hypothetical protein
MALALPGTAELARNRLHRGARLGLLEQDGKRHPELGAKIAGRLLGPGWIPFCLYHSRSYARMHGTTPSKLCYADKASILFDPRPWYLLRATLTGEINEYRQVADRSGFIPALASHSAWLRKLREHERQTVPKQAKQFS